MGRPARLVVPGVAMHVRQRGVNGVDCFRDDTDRLVYLSCLRDLATASACAIHAYCLMTNHVHFLLTPSDLRGCATMMRELGQRYVPYFNRRYRRTGTLWDGRFRSCLVESARYVLACYRYIECNPVESGLAEDTLITPHVEYSVLGETVQTRQAAYRAIFNLPVDRELVRALRQATGGGYALIGDELKSRLVADGERVEPGKPGPKKKLETEGEPVSTDLFGELAP